MSTRSTSTTAYSYRVTYMAYYYSNSSMGPTGCGKTRSAYESTPSGLPKPYFVVMPAQWWDGYNGQDTIIFDDFYGQIRMADMLRYLDGYPVQLLSKEDLYGLSGLRYILLATLILIAGILLYLLRR